MLWLICCVVCVKFYFVYVATQRSEVMSISGADKYLE